MMTCVNMLPGVHVKNSKIYVDDDEKYDGSADELTQDSKITVSENLRAGPGETVKVTGRRMKLQLHPLLNYYCTLSK